MRAPALTTLPASEDIRHPVRTGTGFAPHAADRSQCVVGAALHR